MLAHLTKNSADVEMNISWVEYLKAVFDCFIAEVQVVVLDFKGFLQITQSRPQLLSSSEDASKVVVGHGSVLVSFVGQGFGFSEQLEGNIEVF